MNVLLQSWLEQLTGLELPVPGSLTLLTVAILVAIGQIVRALPSRGVSAELALSNLSWVIVCGLIGARVAHWLERDSELGLTGLLSVWDGGMSLYGAIFAAFVAVMVAPDRRRRRWGALADIAAAPTALALAVGRLGCLLNGDDFGAASALPWAIRFPANTPPHDSHVAQGLIGPEVLYSLPVHPTQVYELLFALLLYVLLRSSKRQGVRAGVRGLSALAAYAVFRFFAEWAREPTVATFVMGLTTGQIGSLFVLLTCMAVAGVGSGLTSERGRALPTSRPN